MTSLCSTNRIPALVLAVLTSVLAQAQSPQQQGAPIPYPQQGQPAYPQQGQPTYPQGAPPPGAWTPQGIAGLGQNASSRTEFTLDRSMIVMASKMVDQDDSDLRRVIAGLNSVSVHSFRFPAAGLYDPGAIQSLREQYHAAGWQHLVSGHNKGERAGISDLWVHLNNAEINDIAVLMTSPTQLNFFSVSGALRPLDLAHLSGHFGIPKFEGGTLVPAPDSPR